MNTISTSSVVNRYCAHLCVNSSNDCCCFCLLPVWSHDYVVSSLTADEAPPLGFSSYMSVHGALVVWEGHWLVRRVFECHAINDVSFPYKSSSNPKLFYTVGGGSGDRQGHSQSNRGRR